MPASEGIPLRLAHDGEDALVQVLECPPAVVVLDGQMPRLDGPASCRRLGEGGLRDPVSVIVVTAAVHPEVWEPACRADAVLAKPFELKDRAALVRRFLRTDRDRPRGMTPPAPRPTATA